MNCPTCDIEYQDTVPHPALVCAAHAGKEARKAKKALDGALETISKLNLEISKLSRERRGFQVMARHMVMVVSSGALLSDLENGKYERVSGEVECQDCRHLYLEHPHIPKMPTFHILCNGKIVKS